MITEKNMGKVSGKVAIYTRPRTRKFWEYIAKKLFDVDSIVYFSDHRWNKAVWIMEAFYNYYKSEVSQNDIYNIISNDELNEIVKRCRYLRSLSVSKSKRVVFSMWRTLEEFIETWRPDTILVFTIDNYILDIMERIARRRGITYLGIVQSFINGYSRFSKRGELQIIREPESEEVEAVTKELLKEDFIPFWVNKKKKPYDMLVRHYLKEKIKKIAFPLFKFVKKDPLNFSYSLFGRVDRMSCDGITYLFYNKYFDFDWETRMFESRWKIKVYTPLQFYPEATIDYWCDSLELREFYNVLITAVESLSSPCILLCIKEHPGAVGYRNPAFYKRLAAFRNVVLIPYNVSSNCVAEVCDVVMGWGGTSIFEAALRDKPAITFGTPYYDLKDYFTKLHSLEDLASLETLIRSLAIQKVERNARELIKNVLGGCFRGELYPGAVDFDPNNAFLRSQADRAASSLREYLPHFL